jgi:hypothetical protein
MGAREHWIEVTPEGAFLIGENDGWTYMRKGAQRGRTPVIVTKIADPRPGSWWRDVWYTSAYHSGAIPVAIAECEQIRAALDALSPNVLSDQAAGIKATSDKMRAADEAFRRRLGVGKDAT